MQFCKAVVKDVNTGQERRTLSSTQHAIYTQKNFAKTSNDGFKWTWQMTVCQL